MNNGDKMNALSTILLYIYRAKSNHKEYEEEVILDLLNSIKSKNGDINAIKSIIKSLIGGELDKSTLIDAITINLPEESVITKKLIILINTVLTEGEVVKYLKTMSPLIKENALLARAIGMLNSTSYLFNSKDMDMSEQKKQLMRLRDELTTLDTNSALDTDNPGDDMESITIGEDGVLFNLSKASSGDKIKLALGWSELSKALAGYLSTGEFVAVEAQQHKNKTGFTLSLFLQTLLCNKLELEDGKKPLWLWLSLEDDLNQIVIKSFVYLYFARHKKMPMLLELSDDYINKFYKDEIRATGSEVIMKRINPDNFTIDSYKKMIKSYELLGYKVICTAVDYLEKAYTDGTKYNTGAIGSGLKNMVTKFRTFIQQENILFITPWQISTEANNITRNGVTDREFLKAIVGKNFTQGSRGLAQEFDIEILVHLCRINGLDYQAVQIGKFKRPEFVDPKDKFMLIPFEKNVKLGDGKLMGPLMQDSAATNMIMKDDDGSGNELNL